MINRIPNGSIGFYAKVAGIGLLLMAVLAGFSNGMVLNRLLVEAEAVKTAANLIENGVLLRAGFGCFIIVLLLDVIVAWALYTLFKPISLDLSLLAAWLRLLYTAVFGASLFHIAEIIGLLDNPLPPSPEQILFLISSFHNGWLISLLFFALHLLILGYLIIRSSGYVPKLIGFLLVLAAIAYTADSLAYFLLPDYIHYEKTLLLIVTFCGVLGELSLACWLLLKGVKMKPVR
ncbi:hypothetical protein CD32_12205 [Lysinibacillus odysseyi 34hs-1 = NBRC 100172]|uniref:DUF4386 domain-containing protein n=1 Tax=Lysinibacillus odysseyi 34hs-1 = NBRC 100172 TaxID=1220589 RepID=A0A0A3IHW2_9BACI|nr:hypothetical protein CD32_12205 [Lysinibacillus odysseyi 34hs-1 = NBRC 100172]